MSHCACSTRTLLTLLLLLCGLPIASSASPTLSASVAKEAFLATLRLIRATPQNAPPQTWDTQPAASVHTCPIALLDGFVSLNLPRLHASLLAACDTHTPCSTQCLAVVHETQTLLAECFTAFVAHLPTRYAAKWRGILDGCRLSDPNTQPSTWSVWAPVRDSRGTCADLIREHLNNCTADSASQLLSVTALDALCEVSCFRGLLPLLAVDFCVPPHLAAVTARLCDPMCPLGDAHLLAFLNVDRVCQVAFETQECRAAVLEVTSRFGCCFMEMVSSLNPSLSSSMHALLAYHELVPSTVCDSVSTPVYRRFRPDTSLVTGITNPTGPAMPAPSRSQLPTSSAAAISPVSPSPALGNVGEWDSETIVLVTLLAVFGLVILVLLVVLLSMWYGRYRIQRHLRRTEKVNLRVHAMRAAAKHTPRTHNIAGELDVSLGFPATQVSILPATPPSHATPKSQSLWSRAVDVLLTPYRRRLPQSLNEIVSPPRSPDTLVQV